MTQVSIAFAAKNLCANHSMGTIFLAFNSTGFRWLPEARPSTTRFIFLIGAEQFLSTAYASIYAFIFVVPVTTCKRSLGSALPGNLEFFRA